MKKTSIIMFGAAVLGLAAFGAQQAPANTAAATNNTVTQKSIDSRNNTEVLIKSVVTVGSNGAPVYASPTAAKPTARTLDAGTRWSSVGQLNNGILWYHLGGNQWVRGIDLGQGSTTSAVKVSSSETVNGKSTATVAKSGAHIYAAPTDLQPTNKTLKAGTTWRIFTYAETNSPIANNWVNLGGNQWVPETELTNFTAETNHTNKVTINYKPGYGIAVWSNYINGKPTGKTLKTGTTWKSFKMAVVNNHSWLNLGGNQWIDANYVKYVK